MAAPILGRKADDTDISLNANSSFHSSLTSHNVREIDGYGSREVFASSYLCRKNSLFESQSEQL